MPHQKDKIAILEAIAESWNQAGINYAVVHGLEDYPESIGRDLDVSIERGHLQKAQELALECLSAAGFAAFVSPHPWILNSKQLFAFRDDIHIAIDFISFYFWRSVLLFDKLNPSSHVGLFKVDVWAGFAKRVLFFILVGVLPKEPWITKSEETVIRHHLESILGSELAAKLIHVLKTHDDASLVEMLPEIRWQALKRSLLQPKESIGLVIPWLSKMIRPHITHPTPIIALVGPDGVGKSTTIEHLRAETSIFTGVLVRNWRPGVLPRLGALIGRPPAAKQGNDGLIHPRRQAGRLQWLRLIYYGTDFIAGHFWADRRASSSLQIVCYDRSGLDMLVDPVRYGLAASRRNETLWRWLPKPDLTILLYDEAQHIYTRKPELTPDEIEHQLTEWLRWTAKGDVKAIIQVNVPPDEIVRQIRDLLIESFIGKNGGSVTADSDQIRWLNSVLTDEGQPTFATQNSIGNGEAIYRYGWLNLGDGRGFLIPLDSRRAAAQALELYSTQSRKAKFAKNLAAVGLQLGVMEHVLRKVYWVSDKDRVQYQAVSGTLFDHVRKVLGREDMFVAISIGAPGIFRKPVLQAVTADGEILAYIWVGSNEKVNRVVQREAETLHTLAEATFSFVTPQVIHAGSWNGKELCLMSPPQGKQESPALEITADHKRAVADMANFHTRWITLQGSDFFSELLAKAQNVPNAYYRNVLERSISTVTEWIGDKVLPFHFCHGDFTPWNMKRVDGKLYIFDWEYSREEAPPAWDFIHFLFQVSLSVYKQSIGEVTLAFREGGSAYKWVSEHLLERGLEPDEDTVRSLLALYLIYQLAQLDSEPSIRFHPPYIPRKRFLAAMLTLLTLSKSETLPCPND